jgi:16S rRNA (uracil1498-N3)-methyltransferase
LEAAFLSNKELYYTSEALNGNLVTITGEEVHHIKEVMRHSLGDEIYLTDGKGKIYKSKIDSMTNKALLVKIIETYEYENKFSNITFCIPRLRTQDRFEFALEKCVELGITDFIIFDSIRTVAKGEKIERWKKLLVSAMKQSLRAWLPTIKYVDRVSEIARLAGKRLIFDQSAQIPLQEYITMRDHKINDMQLYFVFGPEGGFADEEIASTKRCTFVKLTNNRLRTETAIITAASILSL